MNVIAMFFSLNMRPRKSSKLKSVGKMIFSIHTKAFPTYTERILEQ